MFSFLTVLLLNQSGDLDDLVVIFLMLIRSL